MNDQFDDWLDEIYSEIEVCGYKYLASAVLRNTDPIAYRQALLDWEDSLDEEVN